MAPAELIGIHVLPTTSPEGGDIMKEFSVRKFETLRTTGALYAAGRVGCAPCSTARRREVVLHVGGGQDPAVVPASPSPSLRKGMFSQMASSRLTRASRFAL